MNKVKNSVLIVDDENSNIMVLARILDSEYIVRAAKDGQTAIEAAETHLPDVILLDILMPDMDGYAVLATLKNSEKTKNIPVIFVTGLNDAVNEERGLSLGALDYITKPFSPAIVKLRVQNQVRAINQTRLIIEKELAEKSNRTKIDFLLRMSHEMLTPVSTIMGITHILKRAETSKKTQEYLDEIETASRSLRVLIHNLLDTSGKEDGAFLLASSVFSFNTMLQHVLRGITRNAAKKHQTLTTDVAPTIPERLLGDSKLLAQVITNLLANAVKFTPEHGKVHLAVRVRDEESETITLQIEITDSGIGMSKEQQSEIFNIFKQADESLTRKYEGIGLGLSIAKRIIEMMDGEIWVDSELDKGSKFTFTCKMHKK